MEESGGVWVVCQDIQKKWNIWQKMKTLQWPKSEIKIYDNDNM